jgi:VIT1/CCC1 family predicted Fe2+/Mn2+ transporter
LCPIGDVEDDRTMAMAHRERHKSGRVGWLRAAVLGADDGIVSTASLMIGVAASSADRQAILVAGIAGLVAGSMSMAAGEYVSVSSQRDAERADIARERRELETVPERELDELTGIYRRRGLDPALARQVAEALSASDPVEAHLRDELGLAEDDLAKPVEAAAVSALSFALGALFPILAVLVAPASVRVPLLAATTLVFLGLLGVVGASIGGVRGPRPVIRVVIGGGLAMAATALIGRLVGAAV